MGGPGSGRKKGSGGKSKLPEGSLANYKGLRDRMGSKPTRTYSKQLAKQAIEHAKLGLKIARKSPKRKSLKLTYTIGNQGK